VPGTDGRRCAVCCETFIVLLTLTTDFGARDGYVAAMKGALLTACPDATLVDISHEVPPYDVAHGAFVLALASGHFPPGTIHVAVVDPSVGSSRRAVVVVTPEGSFVGPDNGLFTYVLERCYQDQTLNHDLKGTPHLFEPITVSIPDSCTAFVLDDPRFWLNPVSDTFHGRDIFAPVAGHLASGIRPSELGRRIYDIVTLWVPRPVRCGELVRGIVVYVDQFGNLVTNIKPGTLSEIEHVEIQGIRIYGFARSYQESSGPLALLGSHGYLEIALREGSAAEGINVKVGTEIAVYRAKASIDHDAHEYNPNDRDLSRFRHTDEG